MSSLIKRALRNCHKLYSIYKGNNRNDQNVKHSLKLINQITRRNKKPSQILKSPHLKYFKHLPILYSTYLQRECNPSLKQLALPILLALPIYPIFNHACKGNAILPIHLDTYPIFNHTYKENPIIH